MNKKYIFTLITIIITSCSMPLTNFRIVKIPKTPQNMTSYRECQRTYAVATGFSDIGYQNLKRKCMDTLDYTTYYYIPARYEFEIPKTIDGCEQIEIAQDNVYYLCPIENKQ